MSQVPLHDLTWLAAAFDGEGSLVVKPVRGRTISVVVYVCNTDPRYVGKAASIMQVGSDDDVALGEQDREAIGRKTMFTARLQSYLGCAKLLETLLPHLVVKRDKAERFLQWARTRDRGYRPSYTSGDRKLALELFGLALVSDDKLSTEGALRPTPPGAKDGR